MLHLLFCLNLLFAPFAHADIYPDTQNQRRELSTEEKQHLLRLGTEKSGCSASALTPDTLITAEHCLPLYVDGFDMTLNGGYFELDPTQTFKIVTVLDSSKKKRIPLILDVSSHYAGDLLVLKIKWTKGAAPKLLRYTREIIINESQLKFGADTDATKLFTIGYPMDLDKKATYSSGFLKDKEVLPPSLSMLDPYTQKPLVQSVYLKVNVPLINGNSGGAVFTDNYKLVGTVHGGSAAPDSDMALPTFSSQNPEFWNRISAIYHLYPEMKYLQKLFPNGINPNVNEAGEWIGKKSI